MFRQGGVGGQSATPILAQTLPTPHVAVTRLSFPPFIFSCCASTGVGWVGSYDYHVLQNRRLHNEPSSTRCPGERSCNKFLPCLGSPCDRLLWAFSVWLESVAILPQLFLLQRSAHIHTEIIFAAIVIDAVSYFGVGWCFFLSTQEQR